MQALMVFAENLPDWLPQDVHLEEALLVPAPAFRSEHHPPHPRSGAFHGTSRKG